MSKETTHENKHAYELAFHLVPSLGDEKVNEVFEEIIKLVENNKGKVLSKSEPSLLNLEYQMEKTVDAIKSKYNTAYFSWVIFEGGEVIKLKEELDHSKFILRYLLVKTEQTDSISSQEVAVILSGDLGEKISKEEISLDDTPVEIEDAELVEDEVVEDNLEAEDQKNDEEKIDQAIDDLVK